MKFEKNEEAVSPVIGVILMVAITVILAAVIAAFVFGMSTPQHAPQASLTISTATTGSQNITLTHNGGDTIDLYHTKVILDQGPSHEVIATVNGSSDQFFNAGDNLIINTGTSSNANATAYLNGVKELTFGSTTGSFTFTTGTLTVTLLDTVSNQQIFKNQYTVSS